MINELKDLLDADDDAWERLVNEKSPAELAAFVRRICEEVASNPDHLAAVDAELLERFRKSADQLEQADKQAKIATQNAAIASARLDASIDAFLRDLPDSGPERGN